MVTCIAWVEFLSVLKGDCVATKQNVVKDDELKFTWGDCFIWIHKICSGTGQLPLVKVFSKSGDKDTLIEINFIS